LKLKLARSLENRQWIFLYLMRLFLIDAARICGV